MKTRWIILTGVAACLAAGGSSRAFDEDSATNRTGRLSVPKATPAPVIDPAPPPAPRPSGSKSGATADMGRYRSIIERAPFRNSLVPQTSAAGGTPSNAQLKLNGIIRIGDQISAGIEDTLQKRSLILPVGGNEEGIQIQAIDEQSQTVSLFYNGQPLTLTIEKTPGSSGMPLIPVPGQSPGGIQPFPEPATNNVSPPGTPQQPWIKRKRIIIPRER